MRSLALFALALGVSVAACTQSPTGPGTLDVPGPSYSKASGAQVSLDLAAWDANSNGWVCVKHVPAGEGAGNAVAKTIVKDDDNLVCPGGFTIEAVNSGPGGQY